MKEIKYKMSINGTPLRNIKGISIGKKKGGFHCVTVTRRFSKKCQTTIDQYCEGSFSFTMFIPDSTFAGNEGCIHSYHTDCYGESKVETIQIRCKDLGIFPEYVRHLHQCPSRTIFEYPRPHHESCGEKYHYALIDTQTGSLYEKGCLPFEQVKALSNPHKGYQFLAEKRYWVTLSNHGPAPVICIDGVKLYNYGRTTHRDYICKIGENDASNEN